MRVLLRAGRREVEVVVADPLLLAAVIGGDGVEGAMLSSTPIPTIANLNTQYSGICVGLETLVQEGLTAVPHKKEIGRAHV